MPILNGIKTKLNNWYSGQMTAWDEMEGGPMPAGGYAAIRKDILDTKGTRLTTDFDLREFIPEKIWNEFGQNSIWFLNPAQVAFAQAARDYFGHPLTINNWHAGGKFQYSGYRPPDCRTGARFSQHKIRGADDFRVETILPEEIQRFIIDNHSRFWWTRIVSAIELGTKTWTHVDFRTNRTGKLIVVDVRPTEPGGPGTNDSQDGPEVPEA